MSPVLVVILVQADAACCIWAWKHRMSEAEEEAAGIEMSYPI
jgi:hypothetical protein